MKNISRRAFIVSSACLIPSLSFVGKNPLISQSNIMDKIGLQLACVQEKLVSQPQQTLEHIYDLGIRHIELPDVSLLRRMHSVLTGMGFKVHSSHFASPYITENWQPYTAFGNAKPKIETFQELVDTAAKYELKYLIFPDIFPEDRGDLKQYQSFAKRLNEAGKTCKDAGIQLCYHNHTFEFQPVESTSPMEVMLNTMDPDLVKLELDIFYVGVAGISIQEFLKKYSDHVELLQLGDLSADVPRSFRNVTLPPDAYQPIGKGSIDYKTILQSQAVKNIPYYFIDLEQSEDIFADLRASIAFLKSL